MTSVFPADFDDFNVTGSSPSEVPGTHPGAHLNERAAINAIQRELGLSPYVDFTKAISVNRLSTGMMAATTDVQLAQYDIVLCNAWDHARIAPVKALSPTTKFLVYKSGLGARTDSGAGGLYSTGVSKAEADVDSALNRGFNLYLGRDAGDQPDWYLRSEVGDAIIQQGGFTGVYMCDQMNSAYCARWLSNVLIELLQYGWDGVIIDDINDVYTDFTPADTVRNPRTGLPMTQEEYYAGTLNFLSIVCPALRASGKLAFGNVRDGATPEEFAQMLSLLDGATDEFWIRYGNTGAGSNRFHDGDLGWSYTTQRLDIANDLGKALIAHTAVASGESGETASMRYGRASFLLRWAGEGMSTYGFWMDVPDAGDPYHTDWSMAIGLPTNEKFNVDAVATAWRRDYTGGCVILNAADSASKVFTLGATFRRMDGTTASSITLGARTGEVLRVP